MKDEEERFPLPYVRIDRDFAILYRSTEAKARFREAASFLEWVDAGSLAKATAGLRPPEAPRAGGAASPSPARRVELNLLQGGGDRALYEVHQAWDGDGVGHLALVPSQANMERLVKSVAELRDWSRHAMPPLSVQAAPAPVAPPPPQRPAAAPQPSRAAESMRELIRHLDTVRDLLSLVRNDLIEVGKDAYERLILEQLNEAEKLAAAAALEAQESRP
jgi:hypothetical protein